ncbi:hypothetical protein Agub_g9343, partial [Astrephomene gubernaculifera]
FGKVFIIFIKSKVFLFQSLSYLLVSHLPRQGPSRLPSFAYKQSVMKKGILGMKYVFSGKGSSHGPEDAEEIIEEESVCVKPKLRSKPVAPASVPLPNAEPATRNVVLVSVDAPPVDAKTRGKAWGSLSGLDGPNSPQVVVAPPTPPPTAVCTVAPCSVALPPIREKRDWNPEPEPKEEKPKKLTMLLHTVSGKNRKPESEALTTVQTLGSNDYADVWHEHEKYGPMTNPMNTRQVHLNAVARIRLDPSEGPQTLLQECGFREPSPPKMRGPPPSTVTLHHPGI